MYESIGYETYAESDAFKDGKDNFRLGSINRGFEPLNMKTNWDMIS
jgi:hypothetical protein